nr:hypothetical protein CFP56_43214 [Quercus suber]
MAPPPGLYSGTSTLALVARASAFSFGVVYGSIKLKYLQLGSYVVEDSLMATFNAYEGIIINWLMDCKVVVRQRLSLIRKQKRKQRRLITEGNGLCLTLEFRHAFCLV